MLKMLPFATASDRILSLPRQLFVAEVSSAAFTLSTRLQFLLTDNFPILSGSSFNEPAAAGTLVIVRPASRRVSWVASE
jgi:hypothetical protein